MKTIETRHAGVGDLAVGLWIAEGARRAGEPIGFVPGPFDDVVRLFGHVRVDAPSEDCLGVGMSSPSYQEELRTAAARTPRATRWQRTVGWDYAPARPPLGDCGEEAEGWARGMAGEGPLVAIAPRANWHTRTLPRQKWLRVAWDLERRGVRTIAVDGAQATVKDFPLHAYGFGWPHVLALLRRATLVAGNDSGIAHLAATIGRPTVAAMGPTDPEVVFGHCLDAVRPLRAETVPCVGCHFAAGTPFSVACDHGCEALDALPWERVRDAILEGL